VKPRETQVESIFFAALDQPTPEARAACVAAACAGDDDLRRHVERLLSAQPRIGRFLEEPAAVSANTVTLSPVPEQPGDTIGPYKLLQRIGEGGMGVVYMAEQTDPVERRVALKIIKPGMDTCQVIARFEAERQALAMMDHPNIARVLDAGATHSPLGGVGAARPYFVMELVKGLPITQFCDEQHLTPRERLELFLPVCQAVQHAHQKGIIHRDIKPSNILVARYDDKAVPKIIDFGIAKAVSQRLTEKTMFTQYGQIVGTIEYMSPEQAQFNQLDVDTRSDIYSLGVLLYELLTGETPFDKQRLRTAAFDELLRIIREEEPPRPSTRLGSSETLPSIAANRHTEPKKLATLVRGELDWIVMRCLEKDRTRRYDTANVLALDVQRYLADEPVTACPPSAAYRFRKFARRNRAALAVAGLVLFFLMLLGSGAGWAVRDRTAREAEVARKQAAREAEIARERDERQSRITAQVELILDDVERFEKQGKWDDALAAARRAELVLSSGDADPAIQERVRQAVNELELVRRLDQVRQHSVIRGSMFEDTGAVVEAYARAFREFGVDVESLPTDEAVARLSGRRSIALPLAVALDDWGVARSGASGRIMVALPAGQGGGLVTPPVSHARTPGLFEDFPPTRDRRTEGASRRPPGPVGSENAGWATLVAVARGLDPDPLRVRLRELWNVTPESQAELRHLAESLEIRRQPPGTLTLLALTLGRCQLDDLQERVLRQAQQAYPADFRLNFDLGGLLTKTGNHEEGVRFYSAAVASQPTCSTALINLGTALKLQGKLDEAETHYRSAIELDPAFAVVWFAMGNLRLQRNELNEAEADYRRAIELDATIALAHNNLGVVLLRQQKLDEAEVCFRRAIELDPTCVLAHTNLGDLLRYQKKPNLAEASYRRAIELDPTGSGHHLWLAVVLHEQQRLDESIAYYKKGIELHPDNGSAWYMLARAYKDQRRFDDAVEALGKVVELEPDHALRFNELASWLATTPELQHKDPARALKLAQRAVELSPHEYSYWHTLGIAQYRAGNWEEAIAALEKSCQLETGTNGMGNAWQWLFLAMANWRLGRPQEARTWYDKSLELEKAWPEELRRNRDEAAMLLRITDPRPPGDSM